MKVSVIIPAYNCAKTIERAIDSVINQTIQVFEIIIINDGSTDNTQLIVNNYINQHNGYNIKLINKINEGVSKARNLGIKLSEGDYIAFLDSDDYWDLNKVKKQLQTFESNPNIDLLGTARNNELFQSKFIVKLNKLSKISSKTLLYKNFFSTPSIMMKKSVVDEVGYFDENQRYAEEGDYWIRICNKHECYLLNESLMFTDDKPYYGHSGLSGNLKEMEKGELKNIKTAKKLKIINALEYNFLVCFSLLKYFRRIIISKLLR